MESFPGNRQSWKLFKKQLPSLSFLFCEVRMLMPTSQGLSKTAQVRTLSTEAVPTLPSPFPAVHPALAQASGVPVCLPPSSLLSKPLWISLCVVAK